MNGQRHAPGTLFPRERTTGIHWIGGWAGLRAGLDTEVRGKSFASAGDRILVIQSVVRHYTDKFGYGFQLLCIYLMYLDGFTPKHLATSNTRYAITPIVDSRVLRHLIASKRAEKTAVERGLGLQWLKEPRTIVLKRRPLWSALLECSVTCGIVKLLQIHWGTVVVSLQNCQLNLAVVN
jgi:hypothetical protein